MVFDLVIGLSINILYLFVLESMSTMIEMVKSWKLGQIARAQTATYVHERDAVRCEDLRLCMCSKRGIY